MSSTRGALPLGALRRPRASGVPIWSTTGGKAAAKLLRERGVRLPATRWYVEISLDVRDLPAPADFDEQVDTRFHLDLYAEEWGYLFCHGGRVSRIRTTDIAFIHGRDDFRLLGQTPELPNIGGFLRGLEAEHQVAFRREHALVQTDLVDAIPAIRRWIQSL